MRKALLIITPGEILLEEFLKPLGISQNALARGIRVTAARVNDLVHGRRAITPDTAARLSIFFGTTPDFWLNLQARHDAKVAVREIIPSMSKIVRQHHPSAA
jgi:addiction module HigA family antidote